MCLAQVWPLRLSRDVVRRKKDCVGSWVDIGRGETFNSELKSIKLPRIREKKVD